MSPVSFIVLALLAEPSAIQAPPPKTEYHEVLKRFVGTWKWTAKYWQDPQSDPVVSHGTSTTRLVCGGLWALTDIHGTFAGRPFTGHDLTGYDPAKAKYVSVVITTNKPGAERGDGIWDAERRTMTSSRRTRIAGRDVHFRIEMTFETEDRLIQKKWVRTPDGQEMLVTEVTLTRSKEEGKKPETREVERAAPGATDPYAPLRLLAGVWQVNVKFAPTPGKRPRSGRGTERNLLTCRGRWISSTFQSTLFDAHAFLGYDSEKNKYVRYWVDSMTPHLTVSEGDLAEDGRRMRLRGASSGKDGEPLKTRCEVLWNGEDHRDVGMELSGGRSGSSGSDESRSEAPAHSSRRRPKSGSHRARAARNVDELKEPYDQAVDELVGGNIFGRSRSRSD